MALRCDLSIFGRRMTHKFLFRRRYEQDPVSVLFNVQGLDVSPYFRMRGDESWNLIFLVEMEKLLFKISDKDRELGIVA